MATQIDGNTGVSQCQPNSVSQTDLQLGVAGRGPVFSVARITSDQSVPLVTYTKVQFNSVITDTNGNWDPINFRFTPTVAGYYQLSLNILVSLNTGVGAASENIAVIYKNGVEILWTNSILGAGLSRITPACNGIVFLNGSTDFVEGFGYITTGTTPAFAASATRCFFTGSLVRAA